MSNRIWGNVSKHTRHPEYFICYDAAMKAIKLSTLNLQRGGGGGDMGLNGSIFHSIKTQKSSTFEVELDHVFDMCDWKTTDWLKKLLILKGLNDELVRKWNWIRKWSKCFDHPSHLSSTNFKHSLVPAFQMRAFPTFLCPMREQGLSCAIFPLFSHIL